MNKITRFGFHVSRLSLRTIGFATSAGTSPLIGKMLFGSARWLKDAFQRRTKGSLRDYVREEIAKPTTRRYRLVGSAALIVGSFATMAFGNYFSQIISSYVPGIWGEIATIPSNMVSGYGLISIGTPTITLAFNVGESFERGLTQLSKWAKKGQGKTPETTETSSYSLGAALEREMDPGPSFAAMVDQITQQLEADQAAKTEKATAKTTPTVQTGTVPKHPAP